MKSKTLHFLLITWFLAVLSKVAYSQNVHQCTVSIERANEDSSSDTDDITLDHMALEVVQPGSNKIVESFPCTPDGNCFALVQDMP